MASSQISPMEVVEKALIVRNLSRLPLDLKTQPQNLRDKLTIHFQRKRNGGGDVTEVIYPLNPENDDAIIIFAYANDRESAYHHEQVFHEIPLDVDRLPPVFKSVEAQINSIYFKLIPVDIVQDLFTRLIKQIPNVTIDTMNHSKVSCLSFTELECVENEVFQNVITNHTGSDCNRFAISLDDCMTSLNPNSREFEATRQQRGSKRDDTGFSLNQSEAPKNLSFPPSQRKPLASSLDDPPTSQPELDIAQSSSVQDKSQGGFDEFESADALVLDKYIYMYLKTKECTSLDRIMKKYHAKINIKEGDNLKATVVASNMSKTTTAIDNVANARSEFIDLYQKVYNKISWKIVECPSDTKPTKLEEAAKQLYTDDTLVKKVDGNPGGYVIISNAGKLEEVVRHFRKVADIKSSKKLLSTSTGLNDRLTSTEVDTTSAASQYGNMSSKDGKPSATPSIGHVAQASSPNPVKHHQYTTNEGLNIVVRQDDITKQHVDALVNPSDSKLGYAGKVASAIASAAGTQLRTYCREIMKKRRDTEFIVTECIITPGFNLGCQVIHAVGPTCTSISHQTFERDLHDTFLNCLCTADHYGIRSLAMPLIGSGNIGAKKIVCAKALIQAIFSFTRNQHKMTDVYLVNTDRDSFEALKQCFDDAFLNQSPPGTHSVTMQPKRRQDLATGAQSVGETTPHGTSSVTSKCFDNAFLNQSPAGTHSVTMQPTRRQDLTAGAQSIDDTTPHGTSSVNFQYVHAPSNRPGTASAQGKSDHFPDKCIQENKKTQNPASTQVIKSSQNHQSPGSSLVKDAHTNDTSPHAADDKNNDCPICLSDIQDEVVLHKCKHRFCKLCLEKALKISYRCPLCQTVCGQPKGNQPPGTMRHTTEGYWHLRGYPHDGIITIRYNISSGTQTTDHPHPGKHFSGVTRTAYLPDNQEGREVLGLLRKAFDAGLIFTVGRSITSGFDDTVTWNDIHHKTSQTGGPTCYGYPDPSYFKRVKDDLAAKGIV